MVLLLDFGPGLNGAKELFFYVFGCTSNGLSCRWAVWVCQMVWGCRRQRAGLLTTGLVIGIKLLPDLVLLIVWQVRIILVPLSLNFCQRFARVAEIVHKLLVF